MRRIKLGAVRGTMSGLVARIKRHKEAMWGVLHPIVYLLLAAGILTYIPLTYIGGREPPGFELAIVSAIIGGLLFSGGFIVTSSGDLELQKQVRRIGILYLVATIGFIFMSLFLPMARLEDVPCISRWSVNAILFVSIATSTVSFALATAKLAILLPKLWK